MLTPHMRSRQKFKLVIYGAILKVAHLIETNPQSSIMWHKPEEETESLLAKFEIDRPRTYKYYSGVKIKLLTAVILTVFFVVMTLWSFLGHSANGEGQNRVETQLFVSAPSKYDGEHHAVTKFREYLRMDTSHPNPNYGPGIEFLKNYAAEIGLEFQLIEFEKPDLFTILMTWQGSDPEMKGVMLDSHLDVVAANPNDWTHDPFSAYKDPNGNIYARGAQDMKPSTIAQLEAIRRLKENQFQPLRSITLCIVPDEEIGGEHGMGAFIKSKEWNKLNIGFDLGEAGANPTNVTRFDYGEKSIWQFKFTAKGKSGHGSQLFNQTAAEKINVVINKLLSFRDSQMAKLDDPKVTPNDITTINLVEIGGGTSGSHNVIPPEFFAVFDMRIRGTDVSFSNVEQLLNQTALEAGPGVHYEFYRQNYDNEETKLDDSNVWWGALKGVYEQRNWPYVPNYKSGGSDQRYLRNKGIPAIGVSPVILETGNGAHAVDESINEMNFLDSINRYVVIIEALSSIPGGKLEQKC